MNIFSDLSYGSEHFFYLSLVVNICLIYLLVVNIFFIYLLVVNIFLINLLVVNIFLIYLLVVNIFSDLFFGSEHFF